MLKNIAVLMGGYSSEFEISLRSGATVMTALDPSKYTAYAVHILKDRWVCVIADVEYPIDKGDFSCKLASGILTFDACYNTIHGSPGEDGLLQAYLENIGIPQSSCAFYQSALTFNKRDTLSVLKPYHIPMAKSVYVDRGDVDVFAFAKAQVEANSIGYPCFVKPNRAGSSFGISKTYADSELDAALMKAFAQDSEVLIESFLSGTEVSVGVFQWEGAAKALPVCEIVPDGDFFDLEAKYSGKSQEIVPARISDADTQTVQEITIRVYEVLKLKGICRVDFIFHEGKPHFVEVNTNPGLSAESIIPREFKSAGISLTDAFGSVLEGLL
ncbi:MAG: D-alanine-D-alanine ligase [Flavobacteriales bacterium]|jgi:D-alanine-D-alanine ligase